MYKLRDNDKGRLKEEDSRFIPVVRGSLKDKMDKQVDWLCYESILIFFSYTAISETARNSVKI